MSQPRIPTDGTGVVHPAIYALLQADVNGSILTVNPQVVTLLGQYQLLYADCQATDEQCIEFERQPFWYRVRNQHVYRNLESQALRLVQRKLELEYQLSQVLITT